MRQMIVVVKVMCKCGWRITIRSVTGAGQVGKVCWKCGRAVWFVMRGFMQASGKYRDTDGTEHDTKANVIYQEYRRHK